MHPYIQNTIGKIMKREGDTHTMTVKPKPLPYPLRGYTLQIRDTIQIRERQRLNLTPKTHLNLTPKPNAPSHPSFFILSLSLSIFLPSITPKPNA